MVFDQEEALDTLSACFLHTGPPRTVALDSSFAHRIKLVHDCWRVQDSPSLKVLDIGCGQGYTTSALAYFLGNSGHVKGLDPGEPTYGAPITLQQAQEYMQQSKLGKQLSFARATLPGFLKSDGSSSWDAAVFCHSLWYFTNNAQISEQFSAAAQGGIKQLMLAEYTWETDSKEQLPHQLAAQAQVLLHRLKKHDGGGMKAGEPNIRGGLEFGELVALAEGQGWRVARRGIVSPPEGMRDGYWETRVVTGAKFTQDVFDQGLSKDDEENILGFIPKVQQALNELEAMGKPVVTMDVAWAVLELGQPK